MQLQMVFPNLEAHHIFYQFENTPHTHEGQYQVTIPTRGTCHFTHENKRMDLGEGDMLLLQPSDRHCFHIGDDASVLIIIANEKALFDSPSQAQEEVYVRKRIRPSYAKSLFREWMGRTGADSGEWLAEQEAEASLLEQLRQLVEAGKAGGMDGGPDLQAPWDRHIARAAEYIRAHYAEPLTIDELAAVALQSRYHFIRSFKAAVGLTPYQYVLRIRMEEAKRLLRQTAGTATEISFRLGFSAPSQFYRAFEKLVGVTPEQYRSGI
ncbi:AraC family transcriptional regulator [Paenibacillus protaetiae]|nr:AraC family transcriptional regulator [Paenibacillus protaetiae]